MLRSLVGSEMCIRDSIYAGLSPIRRRFLHRRAGEELAVLFKQNIAEVSGQIGAHFEAAGLFSEAVTYYALAGEKEAQLDTFTHAEKRYATAIQLGRQSSLSPDELSKLYTDRGLLLELNGDYVGATTVYPEFESLARAQGNLAPELERLCLLYTSPSPRDS